MITLSAHTPRQAVLDGTADFVVNLADLGNLNEEEAKEFLDSNVLTAGMELLLSQAFSRLAGIGSASGIYKLSESMGGGKTQSMIVAGIQARFPHLAKSMEFHSTLPDAKPDVVASFTGRATDKKVWVVIGEALGVTFASDRAPAETEWRDALKDRSALILLDELAFYLVHAASQGSKEDGTRAATLAGIALTNLFGAIRDFKECRRSVIVIADLQKDWEQGADELARILRSNDTLGGTIQSVNNEMSKGAQSISPVDNSKDELYAILRRRLFKTLAASPKDIESVADAYVAELKKASAIIERPTMKVREEILASYPFHFSTKHLIASFNDNPGFQKTRDVIRLMASIVRSLWSNGETEVAKHYLLALETANLNDANVASRFVEIKKSLQDAMQTDIANSGTSHAETLDAETDGLARRCAQWIFSASLSEVRPRGLTDSELAEYLLVPGSSILGLHDTLKKLYDTCWYIEQTKSGRYLFNRHKNLNAQVNSYTNVCTNQDRDAKIEFKLVEMFEPKDITRMRESQIESGLARCGYTDTDYLLAAQAAAAEVVTGYATIDGVDLEAELRTPNAQRGRSALRTLMDNAKRTATDFLVPPPMDRAIKKVGGGDTYQFWRQFSAEEKFLLKGLEMEALGEFKLGTFQDLGRAYGLVEYESLLGPTRANDSRTALPTELPRPDGLRFDEVSASDRNLWRFSPTRHIYHALKLLGDGAEVERAVKHLVDSTDFWNLRTTRLAAILGYLQELTAHNSHWHSYQDGLTQLAIGIEHYRS